MSMDDSSPRRRATVGVWDVPLALLAPRRVFARVEDVTAYGWSLVWLLTLVTGLGYASVETGLIDAQVDQSVQANIAELEKAQVDVVERSALTKLIEEAKKEGEFRRMMTRVSVIGIGPIAALVAILLIASALFGLVALTGRKPEWHTLLTIGVFASFADVVGGLTRLTLMLTYGSLDVETSLAALLRTGAVGSELNGQAYYAVQGLLSSFDPFIVWFWVIMAIGLTTTSQLRGWRAWLACFGFWLVATVVKTGLAVATGAQAVPA